MEYGTDDTKRLSEETRLERLAPVVAAKFSVAVVVGVGTAIFGPIGLGLLTAAGVVGILAATNDKAR